jgi:erythromycin esterase-like protein
MVRRRHLHRAEPATRAELLNGVRSLSRPLRSAAALGPLIEREKHAGEGTVLVGFGCYEGSVIAGRQWDSPMERMEVPPGRPGSWEDVLHRTGAGDSLLILDKARSNEAFLEERGHRAIGVVYHPEYESLGNYAPTVLPLRYDAFLYFDRAEALRPLHMPVEAAREVPETYPSGV